MRVIVQKVLNATCTVDGKITGSIQKGFLLLVGFTHDDTPETLAKVARKVQGLRIFEDENDKMNKSLHDVGGDILSISQFTLYGDASHGYRPSFVDAMPGDKANSFYEAFNDLLRKEYELKVETGIFGAHMILDFKNDGPTTIIIDSKNL